MRKTYRVSGTFPLVIFLAMLAYTLLTSPPTHLTYRWLVSQAILLIPTAAICLAYKFSQRLVLDDKTMICSGLLRRRKRFDITDVVSVRVVSQTDLFGTLKDLRITFKDNDYINLIGFRTSDQADVVQWIKTYVPDAVDPDVDQWLKSHR